MSRLWLFATLLLLLSQAVAQELELIKSIPIESPTDISTDRNGSIYMATFDGDIVRIDPNLENKEVFSPPNPSSTDLLDAWQGLRIFTFHRELQQYRLINRNLSLHEDYGFPSDKIGFVHLATPTFDNNVWLIDQADFSLKRLQIFSNTIKIHVPLNLLFDPKTYEIICMREYQNRLFLGVKDIGILLFDNLGNYLKTYREPMIEVFGFLNDTIYFIREGQLEQIHIYTDEIRLMPLPSGEAWKYALLSDTRLYLFSNKTLAVLQYSSK